MPFFSYSFLFFSSFRFCCFFFSSSSSSPSHPVLHSFLFSPLNKRGGWPLHFLLSQHSLKSHRPQNWSPHRHGVGTKLLMNHGLKLQTLQQSTYKQTAWCLRPLTPEAAVWGRRITGTTDSNPTLGTNVCHVALLPEALRWSDPSFMAP